MPRSEVVVGEWLVVALRGCECVAAYDVRLAAAVAIGRSGVLSAALPVGDGSVLASLSLRALLAVIELMQDGDDEVRDAARAAVDGAVACSAAAGASLLAEQSGRSRTVMVALCGAAVRRIAKSSLPPDSLRVLECVYRQVVGTSLRACSCFA